MAGRFRRGAGQWHGAGSDPADGQCLCAAAAWLALPSRHRHAGAALDRRPGMEQGRTAKRDRDGRTAGRAARFQRTRLCPAQHPDQQYRGCAFRLQPRAATHPAPYASGKCPTARRQGRAAIARRCPRPAAPGPAGRWHRQRAPPRAAHRAAHDERAVARHLRPLSDGIVEPARRRIRSPAENPRAI